MPTEVTISIPVTARFDGCFCSNCQHMCFQTDMLGYTALRCTISVDEGCFSTKRLGVAIGKLLLDAPKKNGAVVFNGGRNTTMLINMDALIDANIRTRWCCETFGMGEAVQEQPKAMYKCAMCGRQRDYELEKYALCSHCEPYEPYETEQPATDANDAETLRRRTSS